MTLHTKEDFLVVITRIKDENMMLESFIPHYLNEGVDKIYLLDDNSKVLMPDIVVNNQKIIVRPLKTRHPEWSGPQRVIREIKKHTRWVICVDADEFISTKRNPDKTIRQELEDTFMDVTCIKIPWTIYTMNGREKNPKNVIIDTTYRWSLDKRHPHPNGSIKFKCRYDQMEVKCIFNPLTYRSMHTHHPHTPGDNPSNCVDGVYKKPSSLELHSGSIIRAFREEDLQLSYFICNHYRIVSKEHAMQKCNDQSCTLYDTKTEANIFHNAILADYPDIEDTFLRDKTIKRMKFSSSK